ncbi:TPA: hypothetical protein N0F65_008485 [Lagenidium giganteum]|uniref:Uncharacterized protein n=1 Tax=Lagenidium giganteum TaxID=4803 RepID=A0AAV2Z523_9STRA|nr:TPA: hypothetical protein N0F65_008485 [Lagenidium giganteum]
MLVRLEIENRFDIFPTEGRIVHRPVDIVVFFSLFDCVLGVFTLSLLVRVLILLTNHCLDRTPLFETFGGTVYCSWCQRGCLLA